MKLPLLIVIALSCVLAACGSADKTTSSGGAGSSTATGTELTVTVWPDESKPDHTTTTFTGTVAAADLAPTPAGSACTMIYGGPGKATVSGTIDGEAVSATFTRADGCEIARWDKMVQLGVIPAGVGGM